MGDFTLPSLGADMEDGTLVAWRVKPGDTVKRGDVVAVVETQKGSVDVEIFVDGRVAALLVQPGTKVPVGTVLAHIEEGARQTERPPGAPSPPEVTPLPQVEGGTREATTRPAESAAQRTQPARLESSVQQATQPPVEHGANEPPPARVEVTAREAGRSRASPAARTLAGELGVSLDTLRGTGPSGAVTREDVLRAAGKAPAPRPGMRQAIAEAMARSKREIPHYYLSTHVELTHLLDWMGRFNAPRRPAERLLQLAPLLKAVALAAAAVPEMNGLYERGQFHPSEPVNLGVAISLREGGVFTPVLHGVGRKPVEVVGRELVDMVERVRRGQPRSSELSGATLTVTSLGERGVEEVFGVIYPPQVAIVGLGKVMQVPWAADGRCDVRPVMVATLAADHRVSDGHRGGQFLSVLGELLQRPEAL